MLSVTPFYLLCSHLSLFLSLTTVQDVLYSYILRFASFYILLDKTAKGTPSCRRLYPLSFLSKLAFVAGEVDVKQYLISISIFVSLLVVPVMLMEIKSRTYGVCIRLPRE